MKRTMEDIKNTEIIEKIIKFSNDIYKELGVGHLESVYHRALEHELSLNNISYESEVAIPFYYKNHYVGFGRSDIVVNKNLLLELKALGSDEFRYTDISKAESYMKHLNIKKGIMINFPQYHTNRCVFKFI